MAEYSIGFSAHVSSVNEQSLNKAADTIKDYMERNTKLRKAFELPPVKSSNAEEALKNFNAKIIELKKNMATIQFSTPQGTRDIDVSISGDKIKILSQARETATALREKLLNIKADILEVQLASANGDESAKSRLVELNSQLGEFKANLTSMLGAERANSLDKEFRGAVLSVEELKNKVGDATGRIITLQDEGTKVNKVFQSWDSETKTFQNTNSKSTNDFKKTQTEVDKLSEKIKNLTEKNVDEEFRQQMNAFQKELSEINIYADNAAESLKRLKSAVGTTSNNFSVAKQQLSLYKTQMSELTNAQFEYFKRKTASSILEDPVTKKESVDSARERVEILQREAEETRKHIVELGKETEAKRINANATADLKAKLRGYIDKQTISTNIIKNFVSGMKDATARVLNYTIVYRALWGVVRLFRNSMQDVQNINAAFTDIQMVTLGTTESIKELQKQYASLAHEMSSSVVDVAEGADAWLRQGKTAQETNKYLRASMVMAKVGAIEAADSTEYLTSIMNGFQLEAKDAMMVVDSLSQVDIESASSVDDLAVALQRSSNVARNAGVDFQKLVGWIAATKEVTQKSASSIGESFKTILSRMGSVKAGTFLDSETESEMGGDLTGFINDTEKVLSKVGISLRTTTNDFRDAQDVIDDVAGSWKNYTDLEKNAIATSMAGVRQRENFIALMDNYGRATELSTTALNSNGAAQEKYDIFQKSIAASLERINALWQQFIINLDAEGVFKDTLEFLEKFMEIIGEESTASFAKWAVFPSIIGVALTNGVSGLNKYKTAMLDIEKVGNDVAMTASKAQMAMAGFTAVMFSLLLAVQVYDYLIVTNEELSSSISESSAKIKTFEDDIASLNEEMSTTEERMRELQKIEESGSITIVQQEELDILKETNRELAVKIALKKSEKEVEQGKARDNANELAERTVSSDVKGDRKIYSRGGRVDVIQASFDVSYAESVRLNTEELKRLKAAQANVNIESVDGAAEYKRLGDQYTAILDKTNAYIGNLLLIQENSDNSEYVDDATDAIESFQSTFLTVEENIDTLFSDERLSDAKEFLFEMADAGKLSAETLGDAFNENNIPVVAFILRMKELGISIDDIIPIVYDMASAQDKSTSATKNATIAADSYGTIIELVSKKANVIAAAQFQLNKTGLLTVDMVSDLESVFGDLSGILTLVENGFVTTDDALLGLLNTTRAQYELELNNATQAAVKVLNTEDSKAKSYDMTTSAIKRELEAKKALLLTDLAAIKQEKEKSGRFPKNWYEKGNNQNESLVENQIKIITDAINSIDAAQLNIGNYDKILEQALSGAQKDLIEKDAKKDKKEETAYEKQIRLLEHKLYLVQQLSGIYKEDEAKEKEYLDSLKQQDGIFEELQNAAHDQAKSLRATGKKDTDEEIQALQRAWWEYEMERRNIAKDTSDFLDALNKKSIDKVEDILSRLKDAISNLMDDASDKLEEEQRGYQTKITQWEALLSLTESFYDNVNSIQSEMRSINSELDISKASFKYLDENLRKTIFNEDDYNKLSKKLDGIASDTEDIYSQYYNEIAKLTEHDMYKVEEITNEFQRQYDLKKMEFGIVKSELDLVKAQTELQNTLANRNVRMFTGGEWVWTADYKAVQGAMGNVADAEEELERQKSEKKQQELLQGYQRLIDGAQMQSDAAQQNYDEMERIWKQVQKSMELPAETVQDLLIEIGNTDIPLLQQIISNVGSSLSTLLNALGSTSAGASSGYDGAVDAGPISGGNGGISNKKYLENKVAWEKAIKSGDKSSADRLHRENEQYRKDNGILSDKISTDTAKDMLKGGVYDSGGILKGKGGIKATEKDEVVFGGKLSSKMLNPEKSRAFLDMADGMSKLLNNTDSIRALTRAFESNISSRQQSSIDSHDIYLPNGLMAGMSKGDASAMTSIIKRYIPITR